MVVVVEVVEVVMVDKDIKRTSREAGPRAFLRFFPRKLSLSSPSSISEGSYGHWILWVVERSLPIKTRTSPSRSHCNEKLVHLPLLTSTATIGKKHINEKETKISSNMQGQLQNRYKASPRFTIL